MIRANRFARIALRIARATTIYDKMFAIPFLLSPFGFCQKMGNPPAWETSGLTFSQARKKEHKPKLLSPILFGGVGVFQVNGWGPISSCPPSKVCLPWVSKGGIWDVPGILLGCPGPLGVFKKFVQKKFALIFRSLKMGLVAPSTG